MDVSSSMYMDFKIKDPHIGDLGFIIFNADLELQSEELQENWTPMSEVKGEGTFVYISHN